ncbi:STAS domain-containing protein [Limnohabitans sp. Rim8]|jgi:phospholipid transport system transporter-binding protein|uniref:STAS domain-containing protein n=1 Tax=Limnohabitans sp. Rim8 TaxID=1100718 RepID=UPI0025F58382|nr:STAS domain-containing protein [Limnohabitans sp. Rim8]
MSPLKLPATLLHDQADACLAQWVTQLPPVLPPAVSLDASELSEFDSSALAVLLGLRRVLIHKGTALRVEGMPQRLRELASLYGVMDLLQPA